MLLPPSELAQFFGPIDIYLFDQLLKGRFTPGMRLLDAGCGSGRNLPYFLRHGFDVCAVDEAPDAVARVRALAAELSPGLPPANFRVEAIEALTYADEEFDAVMASAVLHFARDGGHFEAMVRELWRVLRPGGLFFARLASKVGLEVLIVPRGEGRFRLPDGSDRFLVDDALLRALTTALGGTAVEPLKTVNVENLRCMTTWCLRKGR
ncbi:MAG TPA: class I SAM-dependent methyltransferase [Vicinamibacteria bacterium]